MHTQSLVVDLFTGLERQQFELVHRYVENRHDGWLHGSVAQLAYNVR